MSRFVCCAALGRCPAPRPWGIVVSLVLVCLVVAGCSSDGKIGVAGEVTYEGKPIEQGEIRFLIDGYAAEAGQIRNGQYTARVPKGQGQVQILAYRENAKTVRTPDVTGTAPIMVNYIPEKYNAKSELKVEINEPKQDLAYHLEP